MKSILVFAALLFIGVYAQDGDHRNIVETLIQNADDAISLANRMLHEYNNHSRTHLLEAIEEEVIMVQALVTDLKKQQANTTHLYELHHVHVIQEQLLHHQNRISEELTIVEEIFNHPSDGTHLRRFLTEANQLLTDAKFTLTELPPKSLEFIAIKREIAAVEKIVKHLKANLNVTDPKYQEESLVRHVRSLRLLVERVVYQGKLSSKLPNNK